MHELSIALSLVDAACDAAARLGRVRVEALHVRLGALSGVVKEALEFSFDMAVKDTPIEGARLQIEDVPVAGRCPQCGVERTVDLPFSLQCPVCGSPLTDMVHGREMELTALEVIDVDTADRGGPAERPEEE
jgi:hydrogenase nickel incorporation protein HypA/HybF